MKALFAAILMMSFVSQAALAREPKATMFSGIAKESVKSLFGRQGDQIVLELVEMNHGDVSTEKWNVILSNGPAHGSAVYEVTVTQKDSAQENEEVATIKIKYLSGN